MMGELKIYHDDGGGITHRSLEYWRKIRDPKWRIHQVTCVKGGGIFNTEIDCFDEVNNLIIILLSGFSCGYGGTGPNGLLDLLVELGADRSFMRDMVMYENKIIYHPG